MITQKNKSSEKLLDAASQSSSGNAVHDIPREASGEPIPDRFIEVAMLAADWFWELNQDLVITYLSQGFESITGLQIDSVIGKTREQAFAGMIDDAEKWQVLGARVNNAYQAYATISALKRADGEIRILQIHGIPYYQAEGEFGGYRGVGADITDSVSTLQALEASDARFRDYAEMSVDWFFELDQDLRVSYISNTRHLPSGKVAREFIGASVIELMREILGEGPVWRQYVEKLTAREAFELDYELHREDGTIAYVLNVGKPVFDGDGLFTGYRCTGTNVTEAKLVQAKLENSELRYKNIIQNVTDIIGTSDQDGVVTYENSAVEQLLGYTLQELKGKKGGDLVLEADREKVIASARMAIEHPGGVNRLIYRCWHKDGSIRVLEGTRRLLQDNQGAAPEVVIHARDITEQRKAEEALQETEQKFRDFAESAADWFWEQDEDLRFTNLYGNFPGFPEFSASDLIGKTRQELAPKQNFETPQWQKLFSQLASRLPFSNFEYPFPKRNGEVAILRINGKPIYHEDGSFKGYRGTGIDITESHRLSEQLSYQASHDPLTGLVNRREFEKRLARTIDISHNEKSSHALCYLDLDQFKVVNDNCGHQAGDELLRQVTSLLHTIVRKSDTTARLGGDEFGLLLEYCGLERAHQVAESVRKAIDEYRFIWQGKSFKIGVSIGLIPIDHQSGNITEVLRDADAACYAAKDAGRNRIHTYSPDNAETSQRREEMKRIVDLTSAFDDQRFVLYHQTILPLGTVDEDYPLLSEILVRMVDLDGKLVLPGVFLPAAERYNLIVQLDSWVLEHAVQWITAEVQAGKNRVCGINLSGMSIADPGFLEKVIAVLDTSLVEPERICFEITETAAIANLSSAMHFITTLRERGCRFALDDFGSGFSSFGYLKTLPVEFLKIDGFFVRDMLNDNIDFEMVKSINDIAHVMGKKTIAEFVENTETLEALRAMGVDYAQGFGISQPQPTQDS